MDVLSMAQMGGPADPPRLKDTACEQIKEIQKL
jgi:hypothetical protein